MKEKENNMIENIWDWIKTIVFAIIIAMLFKIFIGDTTKVQGNSMNDTLHNNDILYVDKIAMKINGPKIGDIVIIDAPDQNGVKYVKRIIAKPGDKVHIQDGKVYVNDKVIEEEYINIPQTVLTHETDTWNLLGDEYFVMGDNRIPGESNDSRAFGPVKKNHILGHVVLRILPFSDFGKLD
ncbi:MAG: signal peptidase I [Peptoniphilaceae bacterium]|nr:signal peptidase I [Peptoniphilaceae bacterium]MDD7383496.1 signal peptidase I [Peptoniphilaceae bacterium]MDY3738669.1 signal peptidase I [Peptoniphilaceae bacterium]